MIQIIRNEAGNCVTFQGSSNPVYWNSCLSGEVDSEDANLINIKNDIRTISESEIVYEFYNIPYTDFLDSSGDGFANALECAEYITSECNVLGSIGEQVASDNDSFNFSLDAKDNTILMSTGDYFPVNTIQATLNDGKLDINSITGSKVYYSNINPDNLSMNSSLMTGTSTSKVNALNALFQNTGTASASAPSITSSLAVSMTQGDTLNYELTANYGVGYEWDLSSVSGIVNIEGNFRKIIGGSNLPSGIYNIPVKAINYNGEASETIVLTIDEPDFSNTKSIKFNNLDYLSANASQVNSALGRSSNGSGSSDAWSISMWVKPVATQNNQTFFYFGGNDNNNEGHIEVRYYGNSSLQSVQLEYGSNNNKLKMLTPNGSLPRNVWSHLVITYDGGTTGASSGGLSTYYGRFNFYINGVLVSTSNSHSNYGYNGSIKDEMFQIGKKGIGTNYIRDNGKIDEIAIWNNDQSSNISDIYNSGNTFDLSTLATPPSNWWRMGDEDTYPTILDNAGSTNLTMNSMTAASIVNDTP